MNYDALLVLSFGGPEGPDDVIPFLQNVTAGRNIPVERLAEVAEHYQHFGGVSPINAQNRALIEALKASNFPLPIYFGNRNWHPFVTDTVAQMKADGIKNALVFVTSAFSSYSGCRQYREDIAKAREAVGEGAPKFGKIRVFCNHPLFIETMAERVKDALAQLPDGSRVVFTAHSIPIGMARGCDYEAQLKEAATLIAQACGLLESQFDIAYQSRSGPPQVPWLEPDILDYLRNLSPSNLSPSPSPGRSYLTGKGEQEGDSLPSLPPPRGYPGTTARTQRVPGEGLGVGEVGLAVVPLGFVSDHMEVLYDLDYEAKHLAEELGIAFIRAGTAGTHPKLIQMIHDLVAERNTNSLTRLTVGTRGPNPDVCLQNCCLRGEGRPAMAGNTR
ncbi:ferrochelatase [Armatimonas sp.]|uniref:ferrochelatase n=1 Tax=Armatimonas sp. TaxID=1872638 RepID=UPI0037507482